MNAVKKIIWGTFFLLLIANIFIFVHSIALGNDINRFETEIVKIHRENEELNSRTYEIDSLQYAASIAARLDFTQTAKPIYLEGQTYALNR